MPGWEMVASLSEHIDCPKKNAAHGWDQTNIGARRN